MINPTELFENNNAKHAAGGQHKRSGAEQVSVPKLQGLDPTGGAAQGSQAGGPTGGVFKKKMRGPKGPARAERSGASKCAQTTRLRPNRKC